MWESINRALPNIFGGTTDVSFGILFLIVRQDNVVSRTPKKVDQLFLRLTIEQSRHASSYNNIINTMT